MMRRWAVLAAVALGAILACAVVPPEVGSTLVLALGGGGSLLAIALAAAIGREAWRHQRFAAGIGRMARPAALLGRPVGLVPGLGGAVVAGLHRPRIFCAEDLSGRLDEEELRAVILHEHHHQLSRAPIRIALIDAGAPVLGRREAGRAWLEGARARVEIAADSYALASGASRPALASALLKLASGAGLSVAPGFATASELRVRALLGEEPEIRCGRSLPALFAVALVIVAGCLALYPL
jgi:Zn-dependent protease with chaperone function